MRKLIIVLSVLMITVMLLSACGQANNKNQTLTCSLSIRCDTILKNADNLNPDKKEIVPQDGIILLSENVSFDEGKSLLDILIDELKTHKIHIDFEKDTSIGSAYVKGIANIYSGDCGELSGWMVRVNGEDLTVGCSDYYPKNNDKIEWLYTCDMGNDL